jgi:hypothetical protein
MVYIAIFLQRGSKRWHIDIDKQVQGNGNGKGHELKDFHTLGQPWLRMRQATDRYLAKKKGPKSTKRCDELLRKLVLEHEQKHIAIVACGHAFSPEALEDLLTPGTLANTDCEEGLRVFLECIHAASLVNEVVSKEEGLEALRLLEVKDVANSSYLEKLFYSMIDQSRKSFVKIRMYAAPMVSTSSLHRSKFAIKAFLDSGLLDHSYYHALHFLSMRADTLQQLEGLSRELNDFKFNRSWAQAYPAVVWLSKFGQANNCLARESQDFRNLLEHALPLWYSWSSWRPNTDRIQTWEKLSVDLRQQVGKMLDLEGPDFDLCHETLAKSLTVYPKNDCGLQMCGSTPDECQDMAERLLCLLERMVTRRPEDRALFVCTMAGPYISKRKLELMELLMSDGFAIISV